MPPTIVTIDCFSELVDSNTGVVVQAGNMEALEDAILTIKQKENIFTIKLACLVYRNYLIKISSL